MNAKVRKPAHIEIWCGVVRYRFRILWALFALPVVTLAMSLLGPKVYEGVLLIRIGQITISERQPVPIELPKVVLDRLKNPAFLRRVSERAFKVHDKQLEFLTRGLPASTLEIKVRARSAQDARAALEAVFVELRAAHEQIAGPYIKEVNEALTAATLRIQTIDAQRRRALARIAATAALTDQRVILATMASEALEADISELRNEEMSLRRSLLPPFTYMTDMVEPIYADDEPIFPKPVLNVVLAVVVVLAISIFVVALQVLQKQDESKASS